MFVMTEVSMLLFANLLRLRLSNSDRWLVATYLGWYVKTNREYESKPKYCFFKKKREGKEKKKRKRKKERNITYFGV